MADAADPATPPTLADRFAALWDSAPVPPDLAGFLAAHPAATSLDRLDVLLLDQRRRADAGRPRPVEEYFGACPDVAADPALKFELVYHEHRLAERSEAADPDPCATRFPELRESLGRQLRV